MNFGINFSQTVIHLVPHIIRGPKMIAWLGALMAGLQSVNGAFTFWLDAKRYAMRFNGQVMYLERYLNDQFDNSLRRIYIDDPTGNTVLSDFVWNKAEQQNDLIIKNKAEGGVQTYIEPKQAPGAGDFVVFLPSSLYSAAADKVMRRHIDIYRIAGKTYTFQTF